MVGSQNYYEGVNKTGMNRAINREKLNLSALVQEINTQETIRNLVLYRLTELIKIRRKLKAFHPQGEQKVLHLHQGIFALERRSPGGDETILSLINITERPISLSIEYQNTRDMISGRRYSKKISIAPLEILWLQPNPQN
jgi:sucrose phosphorylase